MKDEYGLGYFGRILMKKENSGSLVIQDSRVKEAVYKIEGKTEEEFKKNLIETIESEKNFFVEYINELEELSLRIKENGLEATSKHYQNLQSKTEEVGK